MARHGAPPMLLCLLFIFARQRGQICAWRTDLDKLAATINSGEADAEDLGNFVKTINAVEADAKDLGNFGKTISTVEAPAEAEFECSSACQERCTSEHGFDKSDCEKILRATGWSTKCVILWTRAYCPRAIDEFFRLARQVTDAAQETLELKAPADTEYMDLEEEHPVLNKLHVITDLALLLSSPDSYDGINPTNKFWEGMGYPWVMALPQFKAFAYSEFAHWPASSDLVRVLGAESPLYAHTHIIPQAPADKDLESIRFVAISDTHLFHEKLPVLPKGDILIYAGDLFYESAREPMKGKVDATISSVAQWLDSMCTNYAAIILVGGNHDQPLEQNQNHVVNTLKLRRCLKDKLIYLKDKATVLKVTLGQEDKLLRIFGTPVSSDNKLGTNRAFQYLEPTEGNAKKSRSTLADLERIREDMLQPYQDAIESLSVSVFVSHGPFEGTKSAQKSGAAKGWLPSTVASGAVLHVFGHWHEQESFLSSGMRWVNAAELNRINAPHFGGHTIDIPFKELPTIQPVMAFDDGVEAMREVNLGNQPTFHMAATDKVTMERVVD